jgi:hypothetical protein
MSLAITKFAGTTPSHPTIVNHVGPVTHRERKWNLVRRPSPSGVSTNTQVQSSVARERQLIGR